MKNLLILTFILISMIMTNANAQEKEGEKRVKAIITTDMGVIEIELYNETPLHRDNFIKLVKEGYYDGSIFHRVINTFMIQGGGGTTGTEDPGYTVPAEILPQFFHQAGALCAARMPDQVNPKKASSGSQFYIVQGRAFSESELDALEQRMGKKFTPEQRQAYAKVGGAPHLDGDYTVYGEVISGMDVVDAIAGVPTANANKPVKDIKMTIKLVE